ncbi:MAG: zinc metalloprotease HtpX [Candidatus Nanohaloarchaea archaeon]
MVTSQGLKANIRIFALLSVLTGVFLGAGYFFGGTGGLVIGLVFAGLLNFASYWFSDRIVLKMYGARPLEKTEAPDLHSSIEQMAEKAGIPKPDVYINDMQVPNAFATGRNPEHGVVCVTEGLMNSLDQEEVEGVIAHELAHIKNRDSLINAVVTTLAGALSVLAEMAFWGAMFGTDEEGADMIGSLAFMIVVPFIATIVRLAISRGMEYRADSTGVKIKGDRESLSSALKKINSANQGSRYRASRVQEAGSNLFIENPFSGRKITNVFSTHPSLEDRLDNIEKTEV